MVEHALFGNRTGSRRPVRAMSWRETSMPGRAALLLAAALLALGLVLVAAAANSTPRKTVRTVETTTPSAATLDATGCPVGSRCEVTSAATPELTAALTRRFPTAAVINRSRTVDARAGVVYRSGVVAALGNGAVLDVATQCDAGAPRRGEFQMRNAVSHLDLAGNEVVDQRTVTTVVAGMEGCSVSVQLRSTTDSPQVLAAAVQLAHDPTLQLRR